MWIYVVLRIDHYVNKVKHLLLNVFTYVENVKRQISLKLNKKSDILLKFHRRKFNELDGSNRKPQIYNFRHSIHLCLFKRKYADIQNNVISLF